VCIFNYSACDIACSREMNTSSCVCPDDYVGTACERTRDLNCTLVSVDPKPVVCLPGPSDDPKDYLLDGDRKCNVYTLNQQSNLGYFLDCHFATEPPITNITFDYWVSTDQLRLSQPVNWTLIHKIFNFLKLSDIGQKNSFLLSKDQVVGQDPVWFNTTFTDVPDRYWYGRRLYVEISFDPNTAPSPYWDSRAPLIRQFLDVIDRPIPNYNKNSLKPWQIALIVVGVFIAVVAIGVGGFIFYKKKYSKKTSNPKKKGLKTY